MATTSDELQQYQQIDRERMVAEQEMARKKGLRRWNRLMPADEVGVGEPVRGAGGREYIEVCLSVCIMPLLYKHPS